MAKKKKKKNAAKAKRKAAKKRAAPKAKKTPSAKKKRKAPRGGLDLRAISRKWKSLGKPGAWLVFVKRNRGMKTGGATGAARPTSSGSSGSTSLLLF